MNDVLNFVLISNLSENIKKKLFFRLIVITCDARVMLRQKSLFNSAAFAVNKANNYRYYQYCSYNCWFMSYACN